MAVPPGGRFGMGVCVELHLAENRSQGGPIKRMISRGWTGIRKTTHRLVKPQNGGEEVGVEKMD